MPSVTTAHNECESCGKALPPPLRKNRPRRFCNSACRSKAYWDREEKDMREALRDLASIENTFLKLRTALACRTSRKPMHRSE